MKVSLKELKISNFRGLQEGTFIFENGVNSFYGSNGSGKTRLYDAFLWVLFGIDHQERSNHRVYTIKASEDENSRKLPAEVIATLSIDNSLLTLKRVFSQNWITPKGESEEIFKGNTTDFFIDEVPVKEGEYNDRIKDICGYTTFKAVTNPLYFTSLKEEEQRSVLFSMISDVSNEEIAKGNADFEALLNELSGKTFNDFRAMIASKKKVLKDEIKDIPARINELRRSIVQQDFKAIDKKIEELKTAIKLVDDSILSESKKNEGISSFNLTVQNAINEFERKILDLKNQSFIKYQNAVSSLNLKLNDLKNKQSEQDSKKRLSQNNLNIYNEQLSNFKKERESLLSEYNSIKSEEIVFPDGAFDCPTCKRPLEFVDIESKRDELTKNFNLSKTKRLEDNVRKGQLNKGLIDALEKTISEIDTTESIDYKSQIEEVEKDIQNVIVPIDPDIERLEKLIEEKKKEFKQNVESDSSLIEKKKELNSELEAQLLLAGQKTVNDTTSKRIDELNTSLSALNQELSTLEQKEFITQKFEFEKNSVLENKINSLFSKVKFKLFKTQVNGQVVPTCEAYMNDVNFSTLNNASKINAGLDIISVICKNRNFFAPIWIDNRETVTDIPEMESQVINLYVSPTHKSLCQTK